MMAMMKPARRKVLQGSFMNEDFGIVNVIFIHSLCA
jgi:hypothetical protein